MQENAEILLNEFRARVEKKELTRTKIENLFVDNSLDESDVLTVYDGLFLGLFTDFEQLLEELFWGLLEGKITINGYQINKIRKVTISPQSEINAVIAIDRLVRTHKLYFKGTGNREQGTEKCPNSFGDCYILGGQRYLDWLPYDNTIKRAKIFFHNGIPFDNLDDDQKTYLGRYHKIRNAIAHKSPKSQADFNKIIQNLPLLPSQKSPAGYLRSKPRGQQTQYEIASAQLIQIALNLCRINV
ncbi:hypothetical protein [Crocosphaera sp.]|uniref:hypothetical protein n=1 Tax=Crocosphaera sp. TaxID=2729996 RepID=UPI002625A076|nr:hypothetical protein [Crocosphaera sp.]MDJ0579164.1 hypothetical protein [Crocosphaera sp.]